MISQALFTVVVFRARRGVRIILIFADGLLDVFLGVLYLFVAGGFIREDDIRDSAVEQNEQDAESALAQIIV